MANNRGSVEKRGDSYRIIASVGYTTDGRKLKKTMTWTPPEGLTPKQIQTELERQRVLFLERVEHGLVLDNNIPFEEFAAKWLTDYSEKQHKAKTIRSNKQALERINPAIGHIKLSKLQPHHIVEFVNQLATETNKRSGELISPATQMNIFRVLSSILSTAVDWQIITDNPCARVKPPKLRREQLPRVFDDEQTVRLLEAIEGEQPKYRLAIRMLLFGGMRRGELVALQWNDIDFSNGTVSITKAIQYTPEKGTYLDTPKNANSNRVIKIPQPLVAELQEYKSAQDDYAASLGDAWHGENFVFTQDNGEVMHPDTLTKWFNKFIKHHNATHTEDTEKLPNVPIHGLRHTSATLQILNGVNPRAVAGRLGHANTTTTLNIYAHAVKTADAMASDALELVLLKPKKD
ncbi:MAG: site-specific integrase [Oscillospiraceae bacterium]|jgi:integrase|nr:site-specific integrase [Oscillospiraceae bacterium]